MLRPRHPGGVAGCLWIGIQGTTPPRLGCSPNSSLIFNFDFSKRILPTHSGYHTEAWCPSESAAADPFFLSKYIPFFFSWCGSELVWLHARKCTLVSLDSLGAPAAQLPRRISRARASGAGYGKQAALALAHALGRPAVETDLPQTALTRLTGKASVHATRNAQRHGNPLEPHSPGLPRLTPDSVALPAMRRLPSGFGRPPSASHLGGYNVGRDPHGTSPTRIASVDAVHAGAHVNAMGATQLEPPARTKMQIPRIRTQPDSTMLSLVGATPGRVELDLHSHTLARRMRSDSTRAAPLPVCPSIPATKCCSPTHESRFFEISNLEFRFPIKPPTSRVAIERRDWLAGPSTLQGRRGRSSHAVKFSCPWGRKRHGSLLVAVHAAKPSSWQGEHLTELEQAVIGEPSP